MKTNVETMSENLRMVGESVELWQSGGGIELAVIRLENDANGENVLRIVWGDDGSTIVFDHWQNDAWYGIDAEIDSHAETIHNMANHFRQWRASMRRVDCPHSGVVFVSFEDGATYEIKSSGACVTVGNDSRVFDNETDAVSFLYVSHSFRNRCGV